MFREMRRKNQALTPEECLGVLHRGTSGVLAVQGDGDYPYAVPLSYVCDGGGRRILFHCARAGHKLDAILAHDKASFCVVDRDQVVSGEFTTYFRSVIVFGRARVLEDEAQRRGALELLGRRYSPGDEAALAAEIDAQLAHTCLVELTVEHMTGKEARELARARDRAKAQE